MRENLVIDGERIVSRVNGREMICGTLEIPSLADLRERVRTAGSGGRLSLREEVADVRALHADPANARSLFQVASQFNLLEMVSPDVTPERGVGLYEHDRTQGPACAISAGAGTIYRNYFVPVGGGIGQTEVSQVDCLADLGRALGNDGGRLWRMKNGYALAPREGLEEIARRLGQCGDDERDRLRGLLRIGLQWRTQVTLDGCSHLVSQAYCSALPVAYSGLPAGPWEGFARLVLEAAYEATLCAALIDAEVTGNPRVFLTLLGGGAFGNPEGWILDALRRALELHSRRDLDAVIVSYGVSHPGVQRLSEGFPK